MKYMVSGSFLILGVVAVILGLAAWRMKTAMDAAKSGLSEEELAQYGEEKYGDKKNRANMPMKYNQLAAAQDLTSRLYVICFVVVIAGVMLSSWVG